VQKIVLDLRGTATGTVDEAAAAANLFINSGDLAKVVGKDGKVVKTLTADPAKAIFDGKLAVVIDIGTAAAGEVVASPILERKRGEVVGERSFGAGTEQQLFTLAAATACSLLQAKWASPGRRSFLGDDRATTGVKPSVEVKRLDTPEAVEVEDLIDQQEEAETGSAADSRHPHWRRKQRNRPRISIEKGHRASSGQGPGKGRRGAVGFWRNLEQAGSQLPAFSLLARSNTAKLDRK
jgi:C-terminal processing protease CtpA/Prc